VGSDVVWFPRNEGVFFLSFAPSSRKKISYAASFGLGEVPDKYKKNVSDGIAGFHSISVREHRGVELVKELTGRDAQWVVDPTILLTDDKWRAISKSPIDINGYILTYFLGETPYMRKGVKQISKETGLKVVNIAGGNWEFQNSCDKLKEYLHQKMRIREMNIYDVGPAEFIGLFENASIVLTNSYHGMIFAIIFRKSFLSFPRKGVDGRQRSFADMLNLDHGILNEGQEVPSLDIIKQDYDKIHNRLEELRNSSMYFLTNSLNS
jgi:hypothetical protein